MGRGSQGRSDGAWGQEQTERWHFLYERRSGSLDVFPCRLGSMARESQRPAALRRSATCGRDPSSPRFTAPVGAKHTSYHSRAPRPSRPWLVRAGKATHSLRHCANCGRPKRGDSLFYSRNLLVSMLLHEEGGWGEPTGVDCSGGSGFPKKEIRHEPRP